MVASFKDFLGNLFKIPTKSSSSEAIVSSGENETFFTNVVNAAAVISVVELISSLCAVAELKTYKDGKEYKGLEWHSLNVRPNVNQSATEFWKEFYSNLLWNGEVLVIPYQNQKIIADGFTHTEYALRDDIFSGVYKGNFTFNRYFTASEVFYLKYSERPVRRVLEDILFVYSKLFNEASNKYIRSGGSKSVIEVGSAPVGDIDFEEKYSKSIDERMKKFNEAKNATLTLFPGMKYSPSTTPSNAKSSNEISDIKSLFDGAVTRAAQMFKFPPQLVLGEVSGIDDAVNLALTACIDPLLNSVSEEFSGKEFTPEEYIAGNFIAADTTNIKHIDIFSLAANIEKLITSAYMSVDEVREKSGIIPTGEPWAQIHFSTKNQEPITNFATPGGGEQNE